jgi:hypothetical protein
LPIAQADQSPFIQPLRYRQPKTSEAEYARSETLSGSIKSSFPLVPEATAPFADSGIVGQAVQAGNTGRRAQFYAYSFWRQDGPANFLNYPSQFGASQSGFVGEIPFRAFGKRSDGLALILRGNVVRTDRLQNEIGAGIRWKPSPGVPVHVAIEGRQRVNGSNRILAYAVIAPKPIKLSKKLSARAYAQLGISSGQNTVRFLDANANIELPIWQSAKASVMLGPLVSANIQTGSHRIEGGPSVSADMAIGRTRFRLSADWRMQIDGDVARASGPAITASMSF